MPDRRLSRHIIILTVFAEHLADWLDHAVHHDGRSKLVERYSLEYLPLWL